MDPMQRQPNIFFVTKALVSMTSYLTTLWWKGDPDEKNEISGMSRRDVYNVQKSWAAIYSNADKNGFLIFTRMFKMEPETQKFFKFLESATTEEMAQSVVFKTHIIRLMSALNDTVHHLPTPDVSAQILRKLGQTHHQRRIRRKHFYVLREVMVDILQKDLALSADVFASWERFIDFMCKNIFDTLTE